MLCTLIITKERIALNSTPKTSNPERKLISQRHQLTPPHTRHLQAHQIIHPDNHPSNYQCPTISDFESSMQYDDCGCVITISGLPKFDQFQNIQDNSNRQEMLKQSVLGCIIRAYKKLFTEGDIDGAKAYNHKRRSQKEFVQNRTLRFPFTYTISYSEPQNAEHANITITLIWTNNKSSSTIRGHKSEPPRTMQQDDAKEYASLIFEAIHSDLKSFLYRTYADAIKYNASPDYYTPAQPGAIPAYYDATHLPSPSC